MRNLGYEFIGRLESSYLDDKESGRHFSLLQSIALLYMVSWYNLGSVAGTTSKGICYN